MKKKDRENLRERINAVPIEGRPIRNPVLILRDIMLDSEMMNLPPECLDEEAIARAAAFIAGPVDPNKQDNG